MVKGYSFYPGLGPELQLNLKKFVNSSLPIFISHLKNGMIDCCKINSFIHYFHSL